jgi:sulfur carrier protein ThiS
MRVRVKLQLTFADRAPGESNPFEMELAPAATVGDVLESLSIPAAVPKVIMVNGRVATLQRALEPGDELTVFPPLEGG